MGMFLARQFLLAGCLLFGVMPLPVVCAADAPAAPDVPAQEAGVAQVPAAGEALPVTAPDVGKDLSITTVSQGEEPGTAVSADEKPNMTMTAEGAYDFRDADIRNVLKMIAYKSGANIIAGPEVVGLVNIQLQGVTWQKALEVIASTYGYGIEESDSVIMVTTLDNLKKRREDAKLLYDQEPLRTETIPLSFAKAEDIKGSLDKMKTERGSINFDKRTNSIIVSDVASSLVRIREMIRDYLDTPTPQVLIEAKIIETTLGKNDTLGIDWGLSASINGTQQATTFPLNNDYEWRFFPKGGVTAAAPSSPAALVYGTINFAGLSATLDMLKQRSNTNILSNPRIVTLDNQPARVQVGQQYPMPEYTTNQQTGVLQVSGWSYMDIGIIFMVTPHVNNAQMVTLDIEPKITQILSTLPTTASVSASMPVLSNEGVKTSVMIRNGDTLVIAGLIKDSVQKTVKRVPVLGYIPVLGWFFQHAVDTHTKTDLMILLTPHIITPSVERPQP
jgi:type IV pilus assembly protein PilQ